MEIPNVRNGYRKLLIDIGFSNRPKITLGKLKMAPEAAAARPVREPRDAISFKNEDQPTKPPAKMFGLAAGGTEAVGLANGLRVSNADKAAAR